MIHRRNSCTRQSSYWERALYQGSTLVWLKTRTEFCNKGTALAGPKEVEKVMGFSPCGSSAGGGPA